MVQHDGGPASTKGSSASGPKRLGRLGSGRAATVRPRSKSASSPTTRRVFKRDLKGPALQHPLKETNYGTSRNGRGANLLMLELRRPFKPDRRPNLLGVILNSERSGGQAPKGAARSSAYDDPILIADAAVLPEGAPQGPTGEDSKKPLRAENEDQLRNSSKRAVDPAQGNKPGPTSANTGRKPQSRSRPFRRR